MPVGMLASSKARFKIQAWGPAWIKPRMLARIKPGMLVRIEPRTGDKLRPKVLG